MASLDQIKNKIELFKGLIKQQEGIISKQLSGVSEHFHKTVVIPNAQEKIKEFEKKISKLARKYERQKEAQQQRPPEPQQAPPPAQKEVKKKPKRFFTPGVSPITGKKKISGPKMSGVAGYFAGKIIKKAISVKKEKEVAAAQEGVATTQSRQTLVDTLGAKREESGRLSEDQIRELEERIMKNVKEQMGSGGIDEKTGKVIIGTKRKFCKFCGGKLKAGIKYCGKCGAALK